MSMTFLALDFNLNFLIPGFFGVAEGYEIRVDEVDEKKEAYMKAGK